jgi:alkylation response protein AidB-like acyl-CoA dehydrogenase/predicted heme/steroid binding protein
MSSQLQTFSREEVAKHNKPDDAWIIIDDKVYDITKFAGLHPGGEKLLLDTAGTDQTKDFFGLHRQDVLLKYAPRLLKGSVEGAKPVKIQQWADVSSVPYSEPSAIRKGFASPYYTEKHHAFRKAVREILDRDVRTWAAQAEISGEYPTVELLQKLGQAGLIASLTGKGHHLQYGPALPGGVKPEDFDIFMEGIVHEELGRLAAPGATDALAAGMVISFPVTAEFGFKDKTIFPKLAAEILSGTKRICLAVTEPFAGSDVANVRATAVKSADGSHYILNGIKKWITGGNHADYFVTLARTGGAGAGGLSYFLVPRCEGLETKQITTSYSKSAGTALVIYENVKVPAAYLIGGKENRGFVQAMQNFSKERWLICARMIAITRYTVEECWKWSMQREVFGKPLISQPVIRFKLAEMSARLEAVQNWYENITFQMSKMGFEEQGRFLSGPIALLKYETTRVGTLVADQAPQIFGGRAITSSGMGQTIERFCRASKFASILGGSEEILADQAVKMALRDFRGGARL